MTPTSKKSARISVTVSNEMQKKLNDIADRKGLSVSSLVRSKLLEWLREYQDY
jgi:metal-responsive CopG/Arc/MetJ family transcriptional regulator